MSLGFKLQGRDRLGCGSWRESSDPSGIVQSGIDPSCERGVAELSSGEPPWKRSQFERRASGWGIAFQRNDHVPDGQAMLACDAWAACVVMSNSTADRLGLQDDSALWTVIAHQQYPEPVLLGLPTFGGGGTVEAVVPQSGLGALGTQAVARAKSFNPYDDDEPDDDEDDEDDYAPEDSSSFWLDQETHYRWFLRERAPGVRWLNGFRAAFARELARAAAKNRDAQSHSKMKVQRSGAWAILSNEAGGRLGKLRTAVRLPHGLKARDQATRDDVNVLVLASEFDRSAAVAAFADAGIRLAFDPTPGWLNASVEPGQHGWLVVIWRGEVGGMSLEAELANFHIHSGELTVFAAELRGPVELLLRRVGFIPGRVMVDNHPDDPEAFFGIDLDEMAELMEQDRAVLSIVDSVGLVVSQPPSMHGQFEFEVVRRRERRRQNRSLRSAARELLPAEWAQQIAAVWNPGEAAGAGRAAIEEPRIDRVAPRTGPRQVSCRLCDGTVVDRVPEPYPYCFDCCNDAREGLFFDRGFDEPWVEAVTWALKMLAEIEFGGPPAKEQLAQLPAVGPQSDLLMLCRMLTARSYATVLGSVRKSYAWTDWLAHAGLLTDGVRTGRGVTVTAKDGHLCRSLLERQIDDFFHDNGSSTSLSRTTHLMLSSISTEIVRIGSSQTGRSWRLWAFRTIRPTWRKRTSR